MINVDQPALMERLMERYLDFAFEHSLGILTDDLFCVTFFRAKERREASHA